MTFLLQKKKPKEQQVGHDISPSQEKERTNHKNQVQFLLTG